MLKAKQVWGVIFAALFLLTAGTALAIHYGVSQYVHVKGGTNHSVRVYNSTREEMFALLISYESDETFQTCVGDVITPHGSEKFDPCNVSKGCSVEIISVPTRAGIAGAINHVFGVWAKADKGTAGDHSLDPSLFRFEDDDVRACACDELANNGQNKALLRNFGIRCP